MMTLRSDVLTIPATEWLELRVDEVFPANYAGQKTLDGVFEFTFVNLLHPFEQAAISEYDLAAAIGALQKAQELVRTRVEP